MEPVRCSNCGNINPAENSFCNKCGSPLPLPSEDPSAVQAEIRRLRGLVNQINARLDALERKQAAAQESTVQPETQAEVPTMEPVEIKTQAVSETPAPPIPPEEPFSAIQREKVADFFKPSNAEPEAVAATREKITRPGKEHEWEQILGGNWLARIGVLALIIGIGFFLKYAFDSEWIGPVARVVLGGFAGFVMLGLGFYWRKRYPVLTQVLTGGGIAVFYLSVFASSATYHLINIYAATALLLVVSILATLFALRYNSIALSIIGIFGAYFAPFILGAFSEGDRGAGTKSQATFLMVYIVVIGMGVLALSAFRNWRWFTLLGLACSLITYGFWYMEFNDTVNTLSAEISITAIFLIFAGASSIFHLIRRALPEAVDYILMVFTAAAYTGISVGIMWDEYRVWMGGFTLLLAIFYGIFAFLAHKRDPQNARLSRFATAISLVLLTVFIPIQFGDHATATIALAAEGLVLMWLAFREKIILFRYFSYISFFTMLVRLFVFDSWQQTAIFTPVFNERFLAFIVSICFTWLAAYLLWKNRENVTGIHYEAFLFSANVMALWITGIEVYDYSRHTITLSGSLSLLILLALATLTILNFSFWRRKHIMLDNSLAVFNALALTIISIFIWDDLRIWMGLAYLLLAIIFGILTYFKVRRTPESKTPENVTLLIALVFLTAAIPVQFRDSIWTPIIWAVEMVALTWFSFKTRLPFMRYFSYLVLMMIVWNLLLVKTISENNFVPVINQRFLSFLASIAAAYLTIIILRRKQHDMVEWPFIAPYLLAVTNFITIWLISFEVWNSFGGAIGSASGQRRDSLMDARNLALTGSWAICAMTGLIIGIWRHWRWVRIGSLVLMAVTIIKVFAYDVFQLETTYRIIAFVGLGVLLLVSAYLYQRYRKAIKGVFTG